MTFSRGARSKRAASNLDGEHALPARLVDSASEVEVDVPLLDASAVLVLSPG